MENRPKGVFIIAVIAFLLAAVALIVAVSLLFPGTPLDVIWSLKSSFSAAFRSSTAGIAFGFFLLVIGLIMFCSVYGLLRGLKWAWWIVLVIFSVAGIGEAVSAAQGSVSDIPGVLIAALLLFYLTTPRVRSFFDKKASRVT